MYTEAGDGTVRVFDLDTGVELLVYEIGDWTNAEVSPHETRLLVSSSEGAVYIFPVWKTVDELVKYASGCCLAYELTPEEREQFGLLIKE